MNLDKDYWNNRYLEENIPWDAGSITRPIKEYIDGLEDKNLRILIPGAGTGHEATYLHQQGFTNVYICDWAPKALSLFQERVPSFPKSHLLCQDFFTLELEVDLIIEQTFFCAIPRTLRPSYAEKTAALLQEQGKVIGLLFAQEFDKNGPPFGGTKEHYLAIFSPHYTIETLEMCRNSIKPRAEKEFFIQLLKKLD